MWIYSQSRGELRDTLGLIGKGYAGNGRGKNNPLLQAEHDVGPLPRGWYTIQAPTDAHAHLGPIAMPLTPDASNEMFGRGDFFIHADSILNPGFASLGCIVQGKPVRQYVARSLPHDNRLQVVE